MSESQDSGRPPNRVRGRGRGRGRRGNADQGNMHRDRDFGGDSVEGNDGDSYGRPPQRQGQATRDVYSQLMAAESGSTSGRGSSYRSPALRIGTFPTHSNDARVVQKPAALNPNAAVFVPSQVMKAQAGPPTHLQRRRERERKNGQEDLKSRLEDELEREMYECAICCEKITFHQKTWACRQCYSVFHLMCIQKWASKSGEPERGDLQNREGWRCPGCQNTPGAIPYEYRCFCGKVANPRPRRGEETPHTCGKICRRVKEGSGCPHACNSLCHPGPCPPCPRHAQITCCCGAKKKTVRCGTMTEYKCETPCEKLLNCTVHSCKDVCHSGACQDCDVVVEQGCFCGSSKREVPCTEPNLSSVQYPCDKDCPKPLSCGKHNCDRRCHEGECGDCPKAPEVVKVCPCGKKKLEEIEGAEERNDCTDPIPTCGQKCGNELSCGSGGVAHFCERECHEGPCPPCPKQTSLACQCGASTQTIPCSTLLTVLAEGGVKCAFYCKKMKSCKRHKCGKKCCTDREHLCMQICGKKLSCKAHECDRLCHGGKCPPCLNASFHELRCECGAEVLYPPVPCGTKPPICNRNCSRPHPCGHPVAHPCHSELECPPCTYLVNKICYGGHMTRRNIPCYLDGVSCGQPCGRPLPCGLHTCRKPCHPEGGCEESGECQQPCMKRREECGHPCGIKCHGETECPSTRCKAQMEVTCKCGHLKQKMSCTDADRLLATRIQLSGSVNPDGIKILPNKARCLPCDDACARLERNRVLAEALKISDPDLQGERRAVYTEFMKEQAEWSLPFVKSVEKALVDLVKAAEEARHQQTKSHSFQPMNRDQRRLIHEYADYFQAETQSFDAEPKRNVVVTVRKGKSLVPHLLLSEAMVHEGKNRIVPPPAQKPDHWDVDTPSEGMTKIKTAPQVFRR